MRYITFFLNAGFAGTDEVQFVEFDDDITEQELEDRAWERAVNHASMYGVYPESERPEEVDDDHEERDDYTDNIEGHWEEYDAEKHESFRIGNDTAFEDCTR